MDLNTLQNWLWRAASSIRGEVDAARYKDYVLPLVFYKRIDDVVSDELARVGRTLGVDADTAEPFVEADRNLVRFFLPSTARWRTIRGQTTGLGEKITDLSSEPMQFQIDHRASQSTMKYIGVGKIAEIEIPLPLRTEIEQIANMLNCADDKIAAEEDRLTALQALFKSMLHQPHDRADSPAVG